MSVEGVNAARLRMFARVGAAVCAVAMAASGCASVIEGRSQQISVNTNPLGARCGFYREQGMRIATIERTPGNALVEKTKTDILIVCVKPGYQMASVRNHSGVSGAAFVNVIGGVFTLGISTAIGAAVNSSNGSDNKYDSPVNVTMIADVPGQPGGPSALPETFSAGPGSQTGQQQAAAAPASEAPAAEAQSGADASEKPTPPIAPVAPAPARAAGTLPAPGVWECGIRSGKRTFKLQFVVSADHSVVVTSYANAPASVVSTEPLTFTALNPRGARPMNIIWNRDNTMVITGPGTSNGTFHNEGACAKV